MALHNSLPPPHELVGLMPIKLTNSNYKTWRSLFLPILRRYHVLDLLDGSSVCPPQFLSDNDSIPNPEFVKWIDHDGSLLIWLNSTISDSVLPHVCESKSSRDLWLNLENRFRTQGVCDNDKDEEPSTPAYSRVSSCTNNYTSTSKNNKSRRRLLDCVRVAVMVRPLIEKEILSGCLDCVSVIPGGGIEHPQVKIGSKCFMFDHVYKSTAPGTSCSIYDDCVAPLVDDLFRGFNATVLAYGQSGSGKTFTMGINYSEDANGGGIIPKVMEGIFAKVKETKETNKFVIKISFIEVLKEEVFDLLSASSSGSRTPLKIREMANGGITLEGVTEQKVRTKEKMTSCLSIGSKARSTGNTNMNSQSIRSHAIFTISMEQIRITRVTNNDAGDNILRAKLHLVDLAGSERAKRTGTDGLRLKEGIHLNRGLLSLGKVIRSLGDKKSRKEGGHIPYRDSKLTRILQDSLGVNSKTVMIACVSPANSNAEETLNTLEYANRARIIQNKAFVSMSTGFQTPLPASITDKSSEEGMRDVSVNSSKSVVLESVESEAPEPSPPIILESVESEAPEPIPPVILKSIEREAPEPSPTVVLESVESEAPEPSPPIILESVESEAPEPIPPVILKSVEREAPEPSPTIILESVESEAPEPSHPIILESVESKAPEPCPPIILESVEREAPEPSTPKPLSDVTNYTDETQSVLSPLSKFYACSSNLKTTFIQEYLACLNTASKEQLMELKGIGKTRADKIAALREASPIKSLSDLEDIGLSSKQVNGMIGNTARELFD